MSREKLNRQEKKYTKQTQKKCEWKKNKMKETEIRIINDKYY